MALVNEITHRSLEKNSKHSQVECTYDIVEIDGEKFLQLDTYGSAGREMPGKKSQSLRLTPKAISQLKELFKKNNL